MDSDRLQALVHAQQHAAARRQAALDRQEAIEDFWRGADAVWLRVQAGAAERLVRSARRLQARLSRRSAA